MIGIDIPDGTFKFKVDANEDLRDPLPGQLIPVYVCSDGRVTLDPSKGIERMPAVGELLAVVDDGCALVTVYRQSMSAELQSELAGTHLVYRSG